MAGEVTIEVYAYDGSRWSLLQTFRGNQRDRALDLARETYGESDIEGVRVIEETYNSESNTSSQKSLLKQLKSDDVPRIVEVDRDGPRATEQAKASAAYREPKAIASKPVPGAPGPKARAATTARGQAAAKSAFAAAPAKATPRAWAPSKPIHMLTVIAGGGAIAAAGGVVFVLQTPADTPLLISLKATLGPYYLVSVAAAMFAVGLCLAGLLLIAEGSARAFLYETTPARAAYATAAPGGLAAAPTATAPPKFQPVEVEEEEAEPQPAPAEATQLVAFYQQCLSALPRDAAYMKDGKLDARGLFGCHLFLAGLCDTEAKRALWNAGTARDIIAVAMGAVIGDAKSAARFASRYEELLTEPGALAIFAAGAGAAAARAIGDAGAPATLHQALLEWTNKSDTANSNAGYVVVMFTDIVGSTEFTQTHGDAKQFEMVQAHDRIVRAALQEFTGREIKHTGDGIMAAFDNAATAVQAAQRIHREIVAHREVNPVIGMDLRIGVSAGEPIKAGSDLFGATVQLAARICSFAQGGQTLVTEAVKELSLVEAETFSDLGEQELKGFKQPVRVYAVG